MLHRHPLGRPHVWLASFIPLAVERYDLVIRREHARLAAIEAMLDTLNRAAIRRKLEILAGYDTSHTGEVLVT